MGTVLVPPQAPALPPWEPLPSASVEEDRSTGVSPTMPMPLSRANAPSPAMHAGASMPSRFSIWRALESRSDRLASYGALALGLGFVVGFLVVL